MNTTDDFLTLPPPPSCRACRNLEQRNTNGVERSRCLERVPMHEGCGWFSERTPSTQGEGIRLG